MRLIDLSQSIQPDMPRFSAAAPAPVIRPWQSHADSVRSGQYEGCSCEITEVRFLTSLGTYLDSPFHFLPGGRHIAQLALSELVLPGVVIGCTDLPPRTPIGPDYIESNDLQGRAALFMTGWSRYYGRPEYHAHPFLTGAAAQTLVERGVRIVGIDCLVIDDLRDRRRPVHVTLLEQGVLIVENLTNLAAIPPEPFTFHAVPAKVAGAAAFPVRAYAMLA